MADFLFLKIEGETLLVEGIGYSTLGYGRTGGPPGGCGLEHINSPRHSNVSSIPRVDTGQMEILVGPNGSYIIGPIIFSVKRLGNNMNHISAPGITG